MNITTEKQGYRDWMAIDSDSYDGAPDATIQFIGRGETEEEAIEDLKLILEDVQEVE